MEAEVQTSRSLKSGHERAREGHDLQSCRRSGPRETVLAAEALRVQHEHPQGLKPDHQDVTIGTARSRALPGRAFPKC
jgi:hypothetical protein